jgi:hypothetical protein
MADSSRVLRGSLLALGFLALTACAAGATNAGLVNDGEGGDDDDGSDSVSAAAGTGDAVGSGVGTGSGGGAPTTASPTSGAGAGPSGRAIERVHGNGTAVFEGWANAEPMKVRVTNGGQPVANTSVHWEITQGAGNLNTLGGLSLNDTTTDADGFAEMLFRGYNLDGNQAFTAQRVTASIPEASVEFITTTIETGSGYPAGPAAMVVEPEGKDLGSGAAGEVLPGAIRICVYAQALPYTNQPFADIGVRTVHHENDIAGADPFGDRVPPVRCKGPEGTVLTGADGCASCDLELGAEKGQHYFHVRVGGLIEHQGFTIAIQ